MEESSQICVITKPRYSGALVSGRKPCNKTGADSLPTGGWSGQEGVIKEKSHSDENLIGEFRD